MIGAGPDQGLIEQAARQHEWIHYPAPRFGHMRCSTSASQSLPKLMLTPGLAACSTRAAGAAPVGRPEGSPWPAQASGADSMEAKTPSANGAREQIVTTMHCGGLGSEAAERHKREDRGRERAMLPRRRASVFQSTGSDSPPLGCAIRRTIPSGDFLTQRCHAAVTSRTDTITFPALAAYWRYQLYIRYNRGGTETHPCHAGGNFSSY